MSKSSSPLRRQIGSHCFLLSVLLVITWSGDNTRAQLPNSSDNLRDLMQHRQEMSKRAVDETERRRFEDGISDSTFPRDSVKAKTGVVRALTPEQQRALQHNNRGLDLFAKGKLNDAIKEYEAAIRLDPKLAAAYNNLGTAHFSTGRFEQAAASFKVAVELDADFGQALFNLGLAELRLGRQKEASEALDAALRAYVTIGDSELRAGNLKEAESAYRGMLQIDPDYAPALVRLGLVLNMAGLYEEAAQYLQRLAQRESTNAPLLELLGEALYGQKKYEEAAATAERAIKLIPGSAKAHYWAGVAHAAAGHREAALAHLASLRELKSDELAQKLSALIDKRTPR